MADILEGPFHVDWLNSGVSRRCSNNVSSSSLMGHFHQHVLLQKPGSGTLVRLEQAAAGIRFLSVPQFLVRGVRGS